jgi:hypothetical protein
MIKRPFSPQVLRAYCMTTCLKVTDIPFILIITPAIKGIIPVWRKLSAAVITKGMNLPSLGNQ